MFKFLKRILATGLSAAFALGITGMTDTSFQGNAISETENAPIKYTLSANNGYKNVLYYGDWSVLEKEGNFNPEHIDVSNVTHLTLGYLDVDENGNLLLFDVQATYGTPISGYEDTSWCQATGHNDLENALSSGIIPSFINLKRMYPNLRFGFSVGGWELSADFARISKDDKTREKFVNNLIKYMLEQDFDYIDIDWQYPGSHRYGNEFLYYDKGTPYETKESGKHYVQLLQDIKNAQNTLSTKTDRVYELSTTIPSSTSTIILGARAFLPENTDIYAKPCGAANDQYAPFDPVPRIATEEEITDATEEYIHGIFSAVDFANLMTYDMRGAWNTVSGHQSPLYSYPESAFDAISDEQTSNEVLSNNYSIDTLVSFLLGKTEDTVGNTLPYTIKTPVDPSKIVIGAAFYTHGWEDVVTEAQVNPIPDAPGVFQKAKYFGTEYLLEVGAQSADSSAKYYGVFGLGQIEIGDCKSINSETTNRDLKELYPNVKYYWDDTAKAPYYYDAEGGAFFTFDDEKSATAKALYIKELGLGGMNSWMQANEKLTSDGKRNYAVKSIKEALFGDAPLQEFIMEEPYRNGLLSISVAYNEGYLEFINNNIMTEPKIDRRYINYYYMNVNARWYSELQSKSLANPIYYITFKDKETAKNVTFSYGNAVYKKLSTNGEVVAITFASDNLLSHLRPGETQKIKLSSTDTEISFDDIVKIEATTRIYNNELSPESPIFQIYPVVTESDIQEPFIDISKAVVTLTQDVFNETGHQITPIVASVTLPDKTIVPSNEYLVTYGSNREGIGTVFITAIVYGNYKGTIIKEFEILPRPDISNAVITLEKDVFYETDSKIEPNITSVTLEDGTVIPDSEYTVFYSYNYYTEKGTVEVSATPFGNYKGTVTKEFEILPRTNIINLNLTLENVLTVGNSKFISVKSKNEIAIPPEISGLSDYEKGVDYDIIYENITYKDPVKGKVSATITIEAKEENTPLKGKQNLNFFIYLSGDLNSDGEFDIADIIYAKKVVLNFKDFEVNPLHADYTGDDLFNIADVIALKKSFLGIA